MNCQELITVKRYNLPIKIFLFDNQTLGDGASMAEANENVMPRLDLDQGTTNYLQLAAASGIRL